MTADVASISATPVTTKKKKDDKEAAKAAVHARYLMEKYGMKWRSKVANGACWSFLALSFHKIIKTE